MKVAYEKEQVVLFEKIVLELFISKCCYISENIISYCCFYIYLDQARRKQLESGATKTEKILKTPQQKGFYFFISKSLILTGKKHCGESRRCRNASTGVTEKFNSPKK